MSANIVDADALALTESEPKALVCETLMVAMSRAKNTCRRIQQFALHNASELEVWLSEQFAYSEYFSERRLAIKHKLCSNIETKGVCTIQYKE